MRYRAINFNAQIHIIKCLFYYNFHFLLQFSFLMPLRKENKPPDTNITIKAGSKRRHFCVLRQLQATDVYLISIEPTYNHPFPAHT